MEDKKTIFIYTKTANSSEDWKTNNILKFEGCILSNDPNRTYGTLDFTYDGKLTGTRNKAVFNTDEIAGYTITNV